MTQQSESPSNIEYKFYVLKDFSESKLYHKLICIVEPYSGISAYALKRKYNHLDFRAMHGESFQMFSDYYEGPLSEDELALYILSGKVNHDH